MTNRYKTPMSLKQSQQLLAGAKNLERQIQGWQAFGWVAAILGTFVYLVAIFVQWVVV